MNAHPDRPVEIGADATGRMVVVKRYLNADAAVIYREHVALWQSSFGADRTPPGVPEPLSFDDAAAAVTMECVPGSPLAVRGGLGGTLEHMEAAAGLLADLHSSGVPLGRRRSAAGVLRSAQRKAAAIDDGALGGKFGHLVASLAHRVPDDDALVVSHGDFAPRNVLLGPDGRLTLIDFDRLQLASPALDVAYWGAWIWATQRLCDTEPSWMPADQFAVYYLRCTPFNDHSVTSGMAFYRAAALARIVHGWSALATRHDVASQLIDDAHHVLARHGQPDEEQSASAFDESH